VTLKLKNKWSMVAPSLAGNTAVQKHARLLVTKLGALVLAVWVACVAVRAEGLQSSTTWKGTRFFLEQKQANKIKEVCAQARKGQNNVI